MASLTKDELYKIFQESKPGRNKPPDIELSLKIISQKLSVVADAALKNDVMLEFKSYKRYIEKKRTLNSNSRENINMSEVLLLKENYTPLTVQNFDLLAPTPPKKRKSFIELSKQMQHIRTDKILQDLKEFISSENKESNSDCNITLTQILGFLIYRVNYLTNKKVADLGKSIFEENLKEGESFDDLDAIALMHDLTLTKSGTRKVKSYLEKKKVHFPNSNDLLNARKELKPVINTELNGNGVSVEYKQLIDMTTTSLINCVKMNDVTAIDPMKPLKAVYKDGCDGAGSQSTWNSKSMISASDHMFQYSVVPLRVEQDSKVVWKNPTPNAAECTRPVYLLRLPEDDPAIIELVIPKTDMAREQLKESRTLTDKDGIIYECTHQILDTMKDLKLKKKWSGLGGADCIICESKQIDWIDITKIKNGFPITRSARSSMELYETLILEGDGEIIRKPKDFDHRKGLTSEPLTFSDQHSICILHSYINILIWFLKLIYRCHIAYECWIEKKTIIGEPIRRAKANVQKMLKESTGLVLDQVAGANDKTGTSNDGNQARRFFKWETRDVIVNCVEDKYKETVACLHKNLSVILRVISSTGEVNCVKLEEITTETSLLIAEKLPWVSLNYTLHGLLHQC